MNKVRHAPYSKRYSQFKNDRNIVKAHMLIALIFLIVLIYITVDHYELDNNIRVIAKVLHILFILFMGFIAISSISDLLIELFWGDVRNFSKTIFSNVGLLPKWGNIISWFLWLVFRIILLITVLQIALRIDSARQLFNKLIPFLIIFDVLRIYVILKLEPEFIGYLPESDIQLLGYIVALISIFYSLIYLSINNNLVKGIFTNSTKKMFTSKGVN